MFRKKDSKQPEQDRWVVTGAPRPGTEAAVQTLDRGGNDDSLIDVDPSFDRVSFVEWSKTVYDRATAAWKAYDPEPLRAVMDAEVWNAYAKHLLPTTCRRASQRGCSQWRCEPGQVY